jgi:hypothetical protein
MEIEQEIARIRSKNVAETTRSLYTRSIAKFVSWLKVQYSEVFENEELQVERLENKHIDSWIAFLKLQPDSPGIGVYNTFRSSLNFLFREKTGHGIPKLMDESMKILFRGLKRDHAEERQSGVRKLKEGKEHLPFSLFIWIANNSINITA